VSDRRGLLEAFRSLPRSIKLASEAAVAITAILVLVFLVFPGWKPQDCRGTTGAEFAKLELARSVTRGGALDLDHASKDGIPRERLQQPGKLVTYTLDTSNLKGKELTLRTWVLFEGGEPVQDPTLRDQLAATITPSDCADQAVDRIWSPLPQRPGTYKILLEVTRSDGSTVASQATEAFPTPAVDSR
jgi:hypothetical protein